MDGAEIQNVRRVDGMGNPHPAGSYVAFDLVRQQGGSQPYRMPVPMAELVPGDFLSALGAQSGEG